MDQQTATPTEKGKVRFNLPPIDPPNSPELKAMEDAIEPIALPAAIEPVEQIEDKEFDITDDKALDPELTALFHSLINAQEDYRLILEMDPKNPASESKEKLRQVLERLDAEILISDFNLREMRKHHLNSIYGMTKTQVITALDYATARKAELLFYVEAELPQSRPVTAVGILPVQQKRYCSCCTGSETDLNPLYTSGAGLVCRDCFKILHPGDPLPAPSLMTTSAPKVASALPVSQTPKKVDNTVCAICDTPDQVMRHYVGSWLCQACYKIVTDDSRADNNRPGEERLVQSDYFCPNCSSTRTHRFLDTNRHYCANCHLHFPATTFSQVKSARATELAKERVFEHPKDWEKLERSQECPHCKANNCLLYNNSTFRYLCTCCKHDFSAIDIARYGSPTDLIQAKCPHCSKPIQHLGVCDECSSKVIRREQDLAICPDCRFSRLVATSGSAGYSCNYCRRQFSIDELSKIIESETKKRCPLCYTHDIVKINGDGEYFCKGVCGKVFRGPLNSSNSIGHPDPKFPLNCHHCSSTELICQTIIAHREDEVTQARFSCLRCHYMTNLPVSFKCQNCNAKDMAYTLLKGKYLCNSCRLKTILMESCSKCHSARPISEGLCQNCQPNSEVEAASKILGSLRFKFEGHFDRFQRQSFVVIQDAKETVITIENTFTSFKTVFGEVLPTEHNFYITLLRTLANNQGPRIAICYRKSGTMAYVVPASSFPYHAETASLLRRQFFNEVYRVSYQTKELPLFELIEVYTGFPSIKTKADFSIVFTYEPSNRFLLFENGNLIETKI